MTVIHNGEARRAQLGFAPIDADAHYYEPHDAFTRHLEAAFRERAVHVVPGPDGLGRLYYGDRKMGMMKVTQTDYTGAPGSRREFFQGLVDDGAGWRQTDVIDARDFPAMMRRDARLALLDKQGIDATLLFPTVGVAVEHEMHDDIDALYANLRAFNRWLEEDWGFGGDGRIFSAPMISLIDPAQALAETRRVIDAGARLLHVRRGPLYGQSSAHPGLDGFWGLVEEAGIPVAFHVGDAGYHELWAAAWGEPPRPPLQYTSAFTVYLSETAAADTFANLIFNNLFARFPRLRVLSIENGSEWIPGFFKRMKKSAALARGAPGLGGPFAADPVEVFREHFWVCPFFEEDPVPLAEWIGADHVLFGSDWPHPEGLAEPLEFADKLLGRTNEATVRNVMRGNAAALVGLPR
jgi:predicted TIM-barrel fold metal-dependent hydrolase